jgi:hypothetical protein
MEQKAVVTLDHQLKDAKGKALPHPLTSLTIKGELLPESPIVHHILAALLDEKNPPQVNVEFKNVNNVLTYSVAFEHEDDVVAAGKAAHDLAVEAANAGIRVDDLVARKKAAADAAAKAAKAE